MYGLGRNAHSTASAIDNSSLLYANHDDLLDGSLLTPDSASKFDIKSSEVDNAHISLFDNLGIYQYSDSGPSSIQFGDGADTPELGEGLGVLKGDVSALTPAMTDWHDKDMFSQSPLPGPIIAKIDGSPLFGNSAMMPLIDPMLTGGSPTKRSQPMDDDLDENRRETSNKRARKRFANRDIFLSHKTVLTSISDASSNADFDGGLQNGSTQSSPMAPRSAAKLDMKAFRARSSIPHHLSWAEFGRQGILAAYSSRLNPYALHPSEYQMLRAHITKTQVTVYLNLRNAILRLFHRNPLVAVTRAEAAGCARDPRYFGLSQVAYEWLLRNGYINFGCIELPSSAGPVSRTKSSRSRRKTIVVIGAGVSGLGCARQLESLVAQLGEQFTDAGERPPKIIVLEGRNRIGGRVYSHPVKDQTANLAPGLRSTVEMGAQIITGFENGNPLNAIVRGQLGLQYHTIRDNTVLYDTDGKPVDLKRDVNIQTLWNDILGRASVYRHKWSTVSTVKGDEALLKIGEDPRDSYNASGELITSLEDEDEPVTASNPLATDTTTTEHATTGIEKLAGRQYQTAGPTPSGAAQIARNLGFELQQGTDPNQNVNLDAVSLGSEHPTLGKAMDEGILQYHKMLGFTPQDFRLLHWHHANLEYSNAATVNDLSLTGWDQDGGNEFEGPHTNVIGGYTQVPRGLWQLPEKLDVRFRSAVKLIRYSATDDSAATVQTVNGDTFEADKVVLTVPLGVLKDSAISFDPPLPENKASCIERMGFGLLNKVVLVYKEQFWESDRDGWGLLNDADDQHDAADQAAYASNRGRFYYFWNWAPASGRPILVAFMAGAAAEYTEVADNSALVDEATTRLRQIFTNRHVPKPVEVIVTRWKSDPFSRGTYSYVGPRTQHGDYDIMAEPVGPIHFAGEATCGGYPATVHGAYLSGLRAAGEVVNDFLGAIPVPTPLVEPKVRVKTEAVRTFDPVTGQKQKRGYVDVWEPIEPVVLQKPRGPDVEAQAEAYEASIIGAILAELGERPVKPSNPGGMNPYLMYQKDEWYKVKNDCEADKAAATGGADAKAGREEIRVALGHRWRNAAEAVRKPYLEKCEAARKEVGEWAEQARRWDGDATRIREQHIRQKPPPDALKTRFRVQGSAGESRGGGARRGRKV